MRKMKKPAIMGWACMAVAAAAAAAAVPEAAGTQGHMQRHTQRQTGIRWWACAMLRKASSRKADTQMTDELRLQAQENTARGQASEMVGIRVLQPARAPHILRNGSGIPADIAQTRCGKTAKIEEKIGKFYLEPGLEPGIGGMGGLKPQISVNLIAENPQAKKPPWKYPALDRRAHKQLSCPPVCF
jgi:hypothetical protein